MNDLSFPWHRFLGSFLTEEFDRVLMTFCTPQERNLYYLIELKRSMERGIIKGRRIYIEAFYSYYNLLEESLV